MELENSTGWVAKHKVHKSVKDYTRKTKYKNEVYNVACGNRISLNTLWSHLKSIAGINLSANYGPSRKGDVKDSLADISKAKRLLNYNPEFAVKEGIELTWEKFKR